MYLLKRFLLFKGLIIPMSLLFSIMLFGSFGYMLIEHYTFLEAFYMTIITVASVGYGEVKPLGEAGRIFTIFLIIINLGLFTYTLTWLSRYFFDIEFLKKYKLIKMEDKIKQLENHVIICGFGRNGKESAQVLFDNKIPFVILEEKVDPEADQAFPVSYYIKGDATKDEVLINAGIQNAKALITTLPVDADNLFVVLTARQLNAGLTIISRASQDSSVNKLKIAGATNVIMPDKIGGAHMATLVMLPDVVELLSILGTKSNNEFRMAELKSTTSISLLDLDLWKKTGCTILGIKGGDKKYTINPPASYNISEGERLIVMGSDAQIEQARHII